MIRDYIGSSLFLLARVTIRTETHILKIKCIALELAENTLTHVAVELVNRRSSRLGDHRKFGHYDAGSADFYVQLASEVSRIPSHATCSR